MKTTIDKSRVVPKSKPASKTYASVEEALRIKHDTAKAFFEKHALPE